MARLRSDFRAFDLGLAVWKRIIKAVEELLSKPGNSVVAKCPLGDRGHRTTQREGGHTGAGACFGTATKELRRY